MALLQASVSSAPILEKKAIEIEEAKQAKKTTSAKTEAASTALLASTDDPTENISGENALLPSATPAGSDPASDIDDLSEETSVYVVRKGDTAAGIAKLFNVSESTVLSANGLKKGAKLDEGDVLLILPISGVEYTVAKGDTLQSIAKKYKADSTDIAGFNDLTGSKLTVGDKLFIPNGEQSVESSKPIKNLAQSTAKDIKYYENHPTQNLNGYFINPVPGYRKSQGIHDRNAVDLAIPKGTPIHAAASGRVLVARNGYNGGFGNFVIITHPNGTETLYAHMSKLGTTTGAEVSQGEIIGYVGSTGHSTGPHLHFEVHGARNPGADGSWSN
jgi:LysM repeat protein